MGKEWKWEKFPTFMKRRAIGQFFIYARLDNRNPKYMNELNKICGESAYREARRLLKNEKNN